jgi:Glycosyltransferase family 87
MEGQPPRRALFVAASLLGCAAVSVARARFAGTLRVDEAEISTAARLLLSAGFGAFSAAAAWHFLRAEREAGGVPLGRLLAGAVLIHLLAAPALPYSSNDAFSNLAYGHMARLGVSPYLFGPSALPDGDVFKGMVGLRCIDMPSVYGPILGAANDLAGRAATVAGALAIFKLELLAASLGIALLAFGFCRAHRTGGEAAASFVLIAWNPLLAWEVAAQAHNDGVMVLAMVGFVWAATARREWLALGCLTAALYAKFAVLPVLGLYLAHVWHRDRLRAVAMAAAVAAAGVALFAPHWHGLDTLRGPLAAAGGGDPTRVTRSLAGALKNSVFYYLPGVWPMVYRIWWAIGTALLAWTGLRGLARARTLDHVFEDSLLILLYYDLLATPWFLPWYITWTLPLAMAVRDPRLRRLVAIFSSVSLLQYALQIEPFSNAAIDLAMLWLLHRILGPDSFVHLPRRLWQALRTRRAWVGWAAVVLVAMNAFAGHAERRRFDEAWSRRAEWRWTAANTLLRLRTFGTDDGDIQRYFAYASAALGRPYRAHFVRPAQDWLALFATGGGADPDHTPLVTPDRPLAPYRDFLVEYPPGFFLWTAPLALATHDLDTYRLLFSLAMALLLSVALLLCRRMAPRIGSVAPDRLVWWSALAVAAVGVVAVRRYDAVVSFALCAALWACLTRRPTLAGLALGIAIASKGVPVLAAPPIALYLARERRFRELGRAALACAAVSSLLAVPALLGGGGGLLDALRYHAARPLQIESTGAAALALLHGADPAAVQVVESYGSINLVGRAATPTLLTAISLAQLVLLAAVWLLTFRRLRAAEDPARRAALLLEATAASLAAFMVTSKVLSPQYLVWLIPLGLLVSLSRGGAARWLLFAALLLTQLIYPGYYDEVFKLVPRAAAMILLRNGLLAVWIYLIFFRFRREPAAR